MSEKQDVPKVHRWYGRRLEDLSKEELIAAMIELGEWNRTLIEGAHADRMMFATTIKGFRPR